MARKRLVRVAQLPPPITDRYQWGQLPRITLYRVCILPPRGHALKGGTGYSQVAVAADADRCVLEADRYVPFRREIVVPAGCRVECVAEAIGGEDFPLELLDRRFQPFAWVREYASHGV